MKVVKEQVNPDLTTLGGRIEHARRLKHLSQQELADEVSKLLGNKNSIQRQKIGYVEKNTPNRNLTIEELKSIASVLDVSTDYLLCRVSSNNINNINISKETGLNNDSIIVLKEIYNQKKSDILNYLLFNLKIKELTEIFEQYITITYITENLLNNQFVEIEKKYKNHKNPVATKENIFAIKEFLRIIDKIRYSNTKKYDVLVSLLEKSQKELDTISKICTDLEYNCGNWNDYIQDKLNLKAFKTVRDILKSYKDYFIFSIIDKNIHNSLNEIDTKIINNKNIHIDLNLLSEYN